MLYPNSNLITFMLLAVVISYLTDVFGDNYSLDAEIRNALIITANGPAIWRTERLGTARWAVSAKEPACRAGQLPDAASG